MIVEESQQDELNTTIVITHDITAAVCVADTIWMLGRDRDTSGNVIPGAFIKEQFDLIKEGLAWQENASLLPNFGEFTRKVRAKFFEL